VDEARFAETSDWGRRLAERGETAELRAAGRAIQLLAEEVERLRTELAAVAPRGEDEPPSAAAGELRGRTQRPPRKRRDPRTHRAVARRRRLAVVAIAVAIVAAVGASAVAGARRVFAPSLHVSAPRDGAELGLHALTKLAFVVDARPSALERQDWTLDGNDVTGRVRVAGSRLVFVPRTLGEGEHRLTIRQRGGFLGASTSRNFRFVVDRTAPRVTFAHRPQAHAWEPLILAGSAGDAAKLSVNGNAVAISSGRFSTRISAPLPHWLEVVARDRAGNVRRTTVPVAIVPRLPARPVRAVHVTFAAWADPTLHAGVMRLIAEHRINAVELDLKDESGIVGFGAHVPLARRIGATRDIVDLARAVRQLHARGVRVVGRLVCFRDPLLAAAAWKRGAKSEVIQTPDGQPYSGYGGFTNFANPVVRRYNIDVAVAAARLGVDDVLYDYVRRPDGPRSSMAFPGLRVTPEQSIASFLRETRIALRPYRTFLGASVFGVAADRPHEVAQLIPSMARQLDYVAPMVYPSHWGPGEYDVASPNSQPYDIVQRSLRAFEKDVRGTGARVVPWLQDFSLGVSYGPAEVRAQIQAAKADGIREFLLWDPAVTYTAGALTPDARTAKQRLAAPAK
jgi:hypothetical protein